MPSHINKFYYTQCNLSLGPLLKSWDDVETRITTSTYWRNLKLKYDKCTQSQSLCIGRINLKVYFCCFICKICNKCIILTTKWWRTFHLQANFFTFFVGTWLCLYLDRSYFNLEWPSTKLGHGSHPMGKITHTFSFAYRAENDLSIKPSMIIV